MFRPSSSPGGLEAADADPDNPNRIVLSWLPVEGADIYYVYRSPAESGTYSYAGLSQASADIENKNGDTELRYSYIQSFDEGEGGTYWYAVSAASNADISASERSAQQRSRGLNLQRHMGHRKRSGYRGTAETSGGYFDAVRGVFSRYRK